VTKLAALADLIEDGADISDVPGPLRRRAAKALREVPDVSVADLLHKFLVHLRSRFRQSREGGSATGSNIFWRRAMAIGPPNIVALPHISALKADSSL
jgi:hypothetical protein